MRKKIADLDDCLIDALRLFSMKKLRRIRVPFKRPLVVGSGNAAVTGRIIFNKKDAVFADESDYLRRLGGVDGAVIVSASGKKHAPIIASKLKKKGLQILLLTNNPDSPAEGLADKTIIFPKNIEPYTYNTSTYLGMILGSTGEDPSNILDFIRRRVRGAIPSLAKYNAFFFILPDDLGVVREMFITKFDELFGPRVLGRVFTLDQAKHAKTIVPSSKELFISIGVDNNLFGTERINIPFPEKGGFGAAMSIGYYLIGRIQKQKPPWFKKNIRRYVREASEIFGHEIGIFE